MPSMGGRGNQLRGDVVSLNINSEHSDTLRLVPPPPIDGISIGFWQQVCFFFKEDGPMCRLLNLLVFCGLHHHSNSMICYQGPARGENWTSRNGRPFVSFRSIPFAKPPTGTGKFKKILFLTVWNFIIVLYQGI